MPTFHSNTNNKPKNLGKPYPPIILRRDTGRTPGHRAWHKSSHNPPRRAVRNPLRRSWRRDTRDPERDTGHTTRHHPKPTPTSSNTAHRSIPKKYAGKAWGWVGGEGRVPEGDGLGATGVLPSPYFLYSPRNLTTAVSRSSTLSGLVTAQKTSAPTPLSASAPQHRLLGAFSTVVTVTVSTRPTSRPRRPYDRATLSVRETSTTPFPTPFLLDISVTSIKLLNNYSCSHLNYNKIAHTLQAFYAITAGQNQNRTRRERPDTPNIGNQGRKQGRRRSRRGGASRIGKSEIPKNQPKTT